MQATEKKPANFQENDGSVRTTDVSKDKKALNVVTELPPTSSLSTKEVGQLLISRVIGNVKIHMDG